MRIDNLRLENYPPLRHFEITTNSNVVIIAGANGSGKTRLKQALIETFSNPGGPRASMTLGATRPEEEKAWAGKILSVTAGQASPQLQTYMSRVTRGRSYVGTVIRIDSDRAVQAVNYQTWNLGTTDPDDDDVNYSYYLAPFIGRWQQLVNNIHRKAASRDNKIAALVKTGPPGTTFAEALAAHPDPFLPYQQVFAQLLPGKTLEPIDPKAPQEFRYRVDANANPMYFGALSSGEQEVVRVTFDLVWKEISHSVILVDEPELHLHPTLTFRLLGDAKGARSRHEPVHPVHAFGRPNLNLLWVWKRFFHRCERASGQPSAAAQHAHRRACCHGAGCWCQPRVVRRGQETRVR